jgi:peptide/nickel transport system permease protein
LGGVLQGDLGRSVVQRDDVSNMIGDRLPITLQLGVYSILCSILIGVPAGIIAAVKRGSALDSLILFLSNTGLAMPNFWLAILAVYVFSMTLGWLPVQGYVSISEDVWGHVKHMLLPVLVLSTSSLASFARQTRSAMLEVIRQDYIRTARAKGLRENYVIIKHALRNALIPIITLLGLVLGHTIGFTVLIETVFNIPGMSRLLVQSIFSQDYVVVQGCVLIIAVIVSVVNLLVDISYRYVDPKIRYD